RFYQVDPAANRQGEGTGIGLALTRELVKLMGGSIGAGSRPGQGTEMTVILPVQRDVSTPPAGEWPGADNVSRGTAAPEPHSGAIQTGTAPECPLILIAEDNADVVTYLVSCLAGRYNLSVARNGRECIDLAAEIIPDVIISDVMMPYVDGFEACRTLKNDPRTSHIPVIMLTAKADMASRVDGLHHGADAYLAKPFERDELLAHIDNLIESRRRLQQHYLGVAGLAALPAAEQAEDKFVLTIRQIVERHLDDYTFSVEKLCREAGMSTANLHRKLTALTGLSAVRFIRHVRLNRAKEMLRDPANSITAIAMDTGFNDPSYFGRIFKQEFGITPKEWREGK
ncbi:MAG: helix-turn-helix domain-containing protein, partial [Thermoanaerobaculia bacterium]|nr:helix-turn-helix domain-containing protein [Thermoanaerobaculia bacterium]